MSKVISVLLNYKKGFYLLIFLVNIYNLLLSQSHKTTKVLVLKKPKEGNLKVKLITYFVRELPFEKAGL